MSASQIGLAIAGLLQGVLVYPCMLLGQWLAAKLAPEGEWVHMLVAMTVWGVCMVAVAIVSYQFVDIATRRDLIITWIGGFLVGMALGRFMLSKQFRA